MRQSRDKFSRPSPNLNKRLSHQKTRDFSALDRAQGRVSEDQRMIMMQKKVEMYEKLKRGDLEGMNQRQLQEWTVDVGLTRGSRLGRANDRLGQFEKKWHEQSDDEGDDAFSVHSSDIDESAAIHAGPSNAQSRRTKQPTEAFDDVSAIPSSSCSSISRSPD